MAVVMELVEAILNYPLSSLVGLVVVCVLLYLWKSLLVGSSANPLADRSFYRPPAPFVADTKLRDKVIKQGFHINKVPENLDAIVVGSGIGGLATANLLARVGKKVLVLEQHDQAGGCCHTFIDKGFEFDVGIHYVGEMYEGNENKVLLDHMTDGQLVWSELDSDLDLIAVGEPEKKEWYAFKKGLENWRKYLIDLFPEEEKAINTYLKYCGEEIKTAMHGFGASKVLPKWLMRLLVKTGLFGLVCKYFHYARRYTGDVLDSLTKNEKLKLIFSYSFGDFAVIPQFSSVVAQATLVNHFKTGAWYPRGGSSEIAFHMIPAIERSGGKVLVRAAVSQILCDPTGRAIGVRVHKSSGELDLFAPVIISDAGVINTFTQLLPKEVAEKSLFSKMIAKDDLRSGIAALSVFVGLRGTTEELGLKACNVWAFTDPDVNRLCTEYLNKSVDEVMDSNVPMLFAGFPSAKDPTFNDRYPGKSVCTIVTLVNWKWFEDWKDKKLNKRGADYDALKNYIGQRLWDNVAKMYPQLEDKVEFMEVGSPLTNQYYIRAPKGEMYGLDHNIERFADPEIIMALRPETDVPGLVLTGQDIFMAGFVGAMLGGLFATGHILGRNAYFDMLSLQSRLKKEKKKVD